MKIGDRVEHKLTKDWLIVLDIEKDDRGYEIYVCRNKQLEIVRLYDFEVIAK